MHFLLTNFYSINFLSLFSMWNINRRKVKYFLFSSCERFFYFYFYSLFFIFFFYSSHLIPYIPCITLSVGDRYQSYQQPLSEETSSWDFYHEGLYSTSILLFSPLLSKSYNLFLLSSLSSWLSALSLFLEFPLSTLFLSLYITLSFLLSHHLSFSLSYLFIILPSFSLLWLLLLFRVFVSYDLPLVPFSP